MSVAMPPQISQPPLAKEEMTSLGHRLRRGNGRDGVQQPTPPPVSTPLPLLNPTTIVLGLITLVGLGVSVWRLAVGLGPTTALTDAYPWGIWIGFDFALIAFSGTAFTMAGLVYILRRELYRPAMRPAILAGLLGYVAVLVLLMLDLGRWDRFWSFFVNWNLHSPLFEISWCIVLYSTVLLVEASPQLFERLGWDKPVRWVHRIVLVLVIAGLTLSSLHQSTLGTLYLNMPHRLHPLWYTPLLPLFFFVSSIMAGLSMAVLAYYAAARILQRKAEPGIPAGLARAITWVALVYLALKLGEMAVAGELGLLFNLTPAAALAWLELGVCAALPMVLFFRRHLAANSRVQCLGAALVLLGVLLNRFNATLLVQDAPDWAGYWPHWAEWLSTTGVLAAAALAWYLGARYLSVFDNDAHPQRHH